MPPGRPERPQLVVGLVRRRRSARAGHAIVQTGERDHDVVRVPGHEVCRAAGLCLLLWPARRTGSGPVVPLVREFQAPQGRPGVRGTQMCQVQRRRELVQPPQPRGAVPPQRLQRAKGGLVDGVLEHGQQLGALGPGDLQGVHYLHPVAARVAARQRLAGVLEELARERAEEARVREPSRRAGPGGLGQLARPQGLAAAQLLVG